MDMWRYNIDVAIDLKNLLLLNMDMGHIMDLPGYIIGRDGSIYLVGLE